MKPQPLLALGDVEKSSRWYQAVLGFTSRHGGEKYEQLFFNDQMVMQLHHWDAHGHPHLGNPRTKPYGNGVVLWFQVQEIEVAYARALASRADVLEAIRVNSNARHREFWLRDPDGYVAVVAGAHGDVASHLVKVAPPDDALESVASLPRTGLPVCRFATAIRHPREPAAKLERYTTHAPAHPCPPK